MSYRGHAIIFAMVNAIRRRALGNLLRMIVLAASLGGALPVGAADIAPADHVVVRKTEHKLYLYSGDRLIGDYKVALGLNPVGTKERERDFRTPEGRYYLSRRNTHSDYFLSIQVSYPNKNDELKARKNHWAPGGSIMIHGSPNVPKHPATYYESNDWTDGCIALSNSDMVEVWLRTQDNIPIDIYP
jgi:murein L,D-transpeptidase YafK